MVYVVLVTKFFTLLNNKNHQFVKILPSIVIYFFSIIMYIIMSSSKSTDKVHIIELTPPMF